MALSSYDDNTGSNENNSTIIKDRKENTFSRGSLSTFLQKRLLCCSRSISCQPRQHPEINRLMTQGGFNFATVIVYLSDHRDPQNAGIQVP
jgi:hypothetical protein